MFYFLMTEWRSHVPRVGGAAPCVDPVIVIQAEDFIKTATRPQESAAARYKHTFVDILRDDMRY